MSIIQPTASNPLDNPSHSRLHRVIACDTASPDQSVVVDANGYLYAKYNNAYFGDGTNTGNKILYANTAAVNKPNLRYNVSSSIWEYSNDGAIWRPIGSLSYTLSFNNASLDSTRRLVVAHNLGTTLVVVSVYDNSNKQVLPDEVLLSNSNLLYVDLSYFGTITGTWNVKVVG